MVRAAVGWIFDFSPDSILFIVYYLLPRIINAGGYSRLNYHLSPLSPAPLASSASNWCPPGVPRVSPGCPPGVLANLRFPLLWETFFCGNGWAGGSFAKGGEMSSEAEIKF